MRGLLSCLAAVVLAPGALAFDDPFEPNDDCASAWPLAMGSYGDLEASVTFPDYFAVTVEPLHTLTVGIQNDFGLMVVSAQCGSPNIWCQRKWTNLATSRVDLTIRINPYFNGITGSYDLTLSQAVDPCLSQPDDPLENNDTCGQELLLGPGTVTGLQVRTIDPDYFLIPIPPGQIVHVRGDHGLPGSPIRLRYPQPTCSELNSWAVSVSHPGFELLSWKNLTGATEDLLLEVTTGGNCCAFYDLDISFEPDPCLNYLPDPFEPNDAFLDAALIQPGTYPGLNTNIGDDDFYRVLVPPATKVYAVALFDVEDSNLSMFMWEGGLSQAVDKSHDHQDNEQVEWTNLTSTTKTVRILVDPEWAVFNPATCTEYDLVVTFEAVGPHVGTDSCIPSPNSTGHPAAQVGTGSSSIEANAFGLKTIRVPAFTPGSVVYGPLTDVIPIQGHDLCVGQPFLRSPVAFAGPEAVLEWSFDTQAEAVIAIGQTVTFQTWFRDPTEQPTFNFSNATTVTFTE